MPMRLQKRFTVASMSKKSSGASGGTANLLPRESKVSSIQGDDIQRSPRWSQMLRTSSQGSQVVPRISGVTVLTREDIREELQLFFTEKLQPELAGVLSRGLSPPPTPSPKQREAEAARRATAQSARSEAVEMVPLNSRSDEETRDTRDCSRDSETPYRRNDGYTRLEPTTPSRGATTEETDDYRIAHQGTKKNMRELVQESMDADKRSEDSYAPLGDGEDNTQEGWCSRLVRNRDFGVIVCCLIVVNSLVLGIEADVALTGHEKVPHNFRLLDCAFLTIFIVEKLGQIITRGLSYFTGCGCWWHNFEMLLVSIQTADVCFHMLWLHGVLGSWALGTMATLRMLRWTRSLRLIRLTRLFDIVELHMLMVTITGSARSLFWTGTSILLVTYMFALYLVEIVSYHWNVDQNGHTSDDIRLEAFYGSTWKTCFTLYQTVSNGVDWRTALAPLESHISPWLSLAFFGYISFMIFALLNVITGIFLSSAMQTAEDDKRRMMAKRMKAIFEETDKDGSGALSWQEFEQNLDSPEMRYLLKTIDLRPEHAYDLFTLIDEDESGEVSISEFVGGCLHLHGNVKSIDFMAFIREFNAMSLALCNHMAIIEMVISGRDANART